MANIFRQITLNEKGTNAGPYFDVYYSDNCTDYTLAIDGGGVYLPTIGSQVIVTIPDNSQCLKLVNLTDICGNNFVVENIGLTTTTTTTTSTSTTSTTTTSTTSTTTTTTTLAPKFWNAVYCNDGTAVGVPLKMAGTATTGSVVQAGTGVDTCASLASVYVGTPTVFFDKTTATVYASCIACGITTTTTTTAAPVWYQLYNCSDGSTAYSNSYPNGTFSVNQRVVYGGTLFFYVTAVRYIDPNPGGFKWNIASAGAGLTGCPATTTTTTTTTQAPLTLTTTAGCTGGYGTGYVLANNFGGSTGTYDYIAIGTSESNAIANVLNPSTRVNLFGAGYYTFSNLGNGNYWVAILDSNNRTGLSSVNAVSCGTTTSTTTTSTTTTTLAPGYFRALDCSDNVTHIYSTLQPAGTFNSGDRITANSGVYVIDGFTTSNPGGTLYTFTATGLFGCPTTTTTTTTTAAGLAVTNGSVTCSGITGAWRSTFTGGSGTYTYVAYSNSQANAVTMVNSGTGVPGARVTLGGGATNYDWSGIANGTWYVAVKDSAGSVAVQNVSVVVNCTTTTTTSTTTTTTTTLQPVWYNMTQCYTSNTFTSAQYTAGTFNVGDIVVYGGSLYLTIDSVVTSNPGGASLSVSATGLGACPTTSTTTTTTTIPPMDFTFTNSCSGGQGYSTITSITGGVPGGTYEYSTNYGVNWYPASVGTVIGPFADGTNPNIQMRNTLGGGTNKAVGTINCATTTSTTTTSTTSTSTTTTTAGPGGTAYVSITNNFANGTITDVTVNGISISSASFPLAVGDSTSGTTTQVGTNETIRVYFSGASPSPQYIQVTGTDTNVQCSLAAGTSNRLFTNVVIAANGVVDIFAGDGNCP